MDANPRFFEEWRRPCNRPHCHATAPRSAPHHSCAYTLGRVNETLMAVTHELRCVQCKSVLRGLPVTGSCPECGTLIMHTLVGTLDVPSQALARPIHAQRVARSMLAISIGILLSIVGVTAPMFGRSVIDILGAAIPEGGTLADRMGVLLNALGTAVLLIGSLQLSRRDDPVLRTEIGRADRWLLAGLGIWIAAVGVSLVGVTFPFRSLGGDNLQQTWFVCGAVQLIGAAIGAVGLRRFVTVLGRRCRKYRHAGSARALSGLW